MPYLMRSFPGWAFSRSMAATTWGPSRVAFHVTSASEREATYLGIALMRSMYGLPRTAAQLAPEPLVGHAAHHEGVVVAQILHGQLRGLLVEGRPAFG